jgi:hypothetical protein
MSRLRRLLFAGETPRIAQAMVTHRRTTLSTCTFDYVIFARKAGVLFPNLLFHKRAAAARGRISEEPMGGRMAKILAVADTRFNVTTIVDDLVGAGFSGIARYYTSNEEKRLGRDEALAIARAGLKLIAVFENGASPALAFNAGIADAAVALTQASAIGQPEGSAIYFALDNPIDQDLVDGVLDYFNGIEQGLAAKYQLGVYGDGVVCQALLDNQLCRYAWLSASRDYPGSRKFYRERKWCLAQDPRIDQPFHGLAIGLNETNGDYGGFTVGNQLALALDARDAASSSAAPWMDWMRSHLGQIQQTGARPTPFTEEIFRHTDYGPLHCSTPESCAATACAALEETGYKSSRSAAAISFRYYGLPSELKPGCVVVYRWPNGHHHVNFCDRVLDSESLVGLGGNQSHELGDNTFLRKYVIATRWPVRVDATVSATSGPPAAAAPIAPAIALAEPAPTGRCHPYFKRGRPTLVARVGGGAGPWTVPDLCAAYNWPRGVPGGGVIALIELDGGWVASDLEAFVQSVGQPSPSVVDISVDGTNSSPNRHLGDPRDPDVEVAMDLQVAAAAYFAATGSPATIRVYWAANSDPGAIAKAVRAATADGCDVCSISWGADEALWQSWGGEAGTDYVADVEAAIKSAIDAGMVVFAAAGDNDSSDGGPNPTNVDVPSSCPSAIGCGGTNKTASAETVWNDSPGNSNGEGTGGGYSKVFPIQPYQAGAPNGPGRMVPDVSAHAEPDAGYRIFVHGQQGVYGGTSAVAPLYAGLFAGLGRKLGEVSPRLWANHLCFNDIIGGDNGFYRARPGPDPCSGIGSPIGTKIAELLIGRGQAPQNVAVPSNVSERTLALSVELRQSIDQDIAARVAAHQRLVARLRTAAVATRPLLMLADGDSWFDYPLSGNDLVLFQTTDVIAQLQRLGSTNPVVLNLAHHGDAATDELSISRQKKMIDNLRNPANWLGAGKPDAILFSGGGNDIVGERFCVFLDYAGRGTTGLNDDRFEKALGMVEACYLALFAFRDQYASGVPIFGHAYDFPIPNGIHPPCIGPWLQPSLAYCGWDLQRGREIARRALGEFRGLLARLAADQSNSFILVETQGTLVDADWANELHPYPGGFGKIAAKFVEVLRQKFPGRI